MNFKLVWFMIAVVLAYVVQGSIWYTMPFFFAATLGSNYFAIGLLIAIIPLLEVLAAIPFGFYADFGKIKIVAFDSMLALLAVPILFAPHVTVLNTAGAFLLAAGGVGIWISATAYLTKMLSKTKMKFVGYEMALMAIGWSTGPVLGGWLYGSIGAVSLSLVEVLLLAAASFIMIRTMASRITIKKSKAPKLFSILSMERRIFTRIPKYLTTFLLFAFAAEFLTYVVWFSVPLFTIIDKAGVLIGGIVTGVVTIPYIFGDAIGADLYGSNRKHEKSIVIIATATSIITLVIAALFLQSSFFALLILFTSTFAIGVAYVGLLEVTLEKDRKDAGEIAALSLVAAGFGGAAGAAIVGATAATYGLTVSALAYAVIGLIFIAYFHRAFERFGRS